MRLVGAQKLAAFLADSRKPCGVCFFGRVKTAEVDLPAVHYGSGCETPSSVVSINAARKLPGASAVSVPSVFGKGRFAQVQEAVVHTVKIFVIDVFRPLASEHYPDHAVRAITTVIYADPNIFTVRRTRLLTGEALVPIGVRLCVRKMVQRTLLPSERARLRIIREALAQILCVWQPPVFSHWGIMP